MCFFPRVGNPNSKAWKYGLREYNCGHCPECLSAKARQWALRAVMQAKVSKSCMVTLTYDHYKYNEKGEIIGEEIGSYEVCKKDCQDFIKRLRYYFPNALYILSAEYGKRTGRAHYHAILFNVDFADAVPYKRSKRGNLIYKSPMLGRIWKHGICTIDCKNATVQTARYCTKYCAKDYGIDDTFMLFSRKIGHDKLIEEFNGLYYMIEGKKYPIPRTIWQEVIYKKYAPLDSELGDKFRYVNNISKCVDPKYPEYRIYKDRYYQEVKRAERNRYKRMLYAHYRDNDVIYKRYLAYWKRFAKYVERVRLPVEQRIALLPDDRYHTYKVKCYKLLQRMAYLPHLYHFPPRTKHYGYNDSQKRLPSWQNTLVPLRLSELLCAHKGIDNSICRSRPCLKTANDKMNWIITKEAVQISAVDTAYRLERRI